MKLEKYAKKLSDNFHGNRISEKFLKVWIDENVHRKHTSGDLKDNEYILYKMWCQLNDEKLYKQYLPNTMVMSGSMNRTDKVIFHGGCQPCVSQDIHGVERCKNCAYFKFDWSKEDISINNLKPKKSEQIN